MFLEARPVQRVQRVCRRLRVQSHPIPCHSTLIVLFQVVVRHACGVHGLQRTISGITYSQNLVGLLFVELGRHCHSISLAEVVAAETSKVKTTRTLGPREMEVVRNVFDSTVIMSRTTVPHNLSTSSGQASWTVGANPTLHPWTMACREDGDVATAQSTRVRAADRCTSTSTPATSDYQKRPN